MTETSGQQGGTGGTGLPTGAGRRWRFKLVTKRLLKRLAVLFLLILVALLVCYRVMIAMPGASYRGPLPPATAQQQEIAGKLRAHVSYLAADIGRRSIFWPKKIAEAAAWLHDQLGAIGYGTIAEYPVERGSPSPTLEVTLAARPGSPCASEIVVIGAHYDSFQVTPGADDNASGVAAVLVLAERFARDPQDRTIKFVLFTNEEPPNFMTPTMGSWVYAKACRARGDNITAMLSLETLGYYSSEPGSQKYPQPLGALYPSTGDFVGFVGNVSSRGLVRRAIRSFRKHAQFPSEGAALPEGIPGIGWSDHWAFWQEGYPGVMVTDTAPFRNPHYHAASDAPETLDYDRFARVVEGLEAVIRDLATRSN